MSTLAAAPPLSLSLSSPHLPSHCGVPPLSLTPLRISPSHLSVPLPRRKYHYPSLRSTNPSSSSSPSSSRTGLGFLSPDAYEKLMQLEEFHRRHEFQDGGALEIRLMAADELRATAKLLAESFADSVLIPARYTRFLEFLVGQYLEQKRAQLPHAATLVGFYLEDGAAAADARLAATAEVSFNARGSNVSSPSPPPPRDAPYICNMTVEQSLRRKGIGWQMLRTCEELISKMRSSSSQVYLHCRIIDEGPLFMYKKAGYSILASDTILVWLKLQQRKHLMCKQLVASFEDHPI